HLVFSTLHTNNAAAAIDRIIDVFPPHQQGQIRTQLADVLEGVIAQQLLPTKDGKGRVAAFEILLGNPAVRNLIREGKTYQLSTVIQTEKKSGMQTMDDSLYELYSKDMVSSDTILEYAVDPTAMKKRTISF
ncbi:MAG: type IV pili twitching motility protein PilT, partial [Lachnospiraceae bacterium]